MSFVDEFKNASLLKTTENGGVAYSKLDNDLLSFFAIVGAMRNRSEKDIIDMYMAARNEDKELADKIILYARDIRGGGLGERRVGRILLKELAKLDPKKVIRNFETFVEVGRFDDLYSLVDTPCENEMWEFMHRTLIADLIKSTRGEPISLAAKWMKSINTSSAESRKLAKKFCQVNNESERAYRKSLSILRKYSNVVETKMSSNKWNSINYETVPSLAMKKYTNCFSKRDEERFNKYMKDVRNGKAKINAATLFPYDLVEDYLCNSPKNDITEAQWKALPNYFKEGRNVICCADVSGSMGGMPMAASIGLALYCAQHNSGPYKNLMLTFTDIPQFFEIKDSDSLYDNVRRIRNHVGYNTNMDGMFKAIYEVAKKANESPESLVIISDMEIDRFMRAGACDSIIDKWAKKFNEIGLDCPKLILWNAAARNNTYLTSGHPYVSFVSGVSAGTFANLSTLIDKSAYDAMIDILNQYEYK